MLDPGLVAAYNNRAKGCYDRGEYDQAIEDWTKAIQLGPSFAHAYSMRAKTYQVLGDQAKAEADFAKAKELGYEPE